MEVVTTQQGENFTHRTLWAVMQRQIENAERNSVGSSFDDIAAAVFAFHAFEAYLNFLGSRLAPEIWKNEQEFFRKEPYRGFDGRVRKLFDLSGVPEPERLTRPYGTIWKLKDLRDEIAHGKTQKIERHYAHSPGVELPFLPSRFNHVTHAFVCEARDDTQAIARVLHEASANLCTASGLPVITDPWFGVGPFEGPQGYLVGSSSWL